MRTTAKTRRKGLLVPADDLAVGRWYCVHGVRGDPDQVWPVFGQAFNIKAINLPFVVGELASDPSQPVTFDLRHLEIMAVTQDYAEAQRPRTSRDA
jgi:hypothetical protein